MRLVVCVICLAAATTSIAEEPSPPSTKQLFESGVGHYNLSEWAAALDDFKAAYRSKADPVFLFNIGQCYRQMGEPQEAINAYRAYLRETPDAPNRSEVERLIGLMQETLRARSQPPMGVAAATTPPPPAPAIDPTKERVAGIALMGTGGALLIAGGVFVGLAYAANGNAGQNGQYQPGQIAARNTYEALDVAAFAVGGAAAVTGAILYALGRRSRSFAAAPSVAPGFVGARALVRF
jgi:tetratricopeptide (TPR) repeat protein